MAVLFWYQNNTPMYKWSPCIVYDKSRLDMRKQIWELEAYRSLMLGPALAILQNIYFNY